MGNIQQLNDLLNIEKHLYELVRDNVVELIDELDPDLSIPQILPWQSGVKGETPRIEILITSQGILNANPTLGRQPPGSVQGQPQLVDPISYNAQAIVTAIYDKATKPAYVPGLLRLALLPETVTETEGVSKIYLLDMPTEEASSFSENQNDKTYEYSITYSMRAQINHELYNTARSPD